MFFNIPFQINALNDGYRQRLAVALVNDGRRFWPSMKPFETGNGNMREAFFSYIPSSEYDVKAIHPWDSCDYRDMTGKHKRM